MTFSGLPSISALYSAWYPPIDVFFNIVRIHEAAIPQHDLLLAFEEGNFVPQRNLRITASILDGRRDVIPLFHFAINEIGRKISAGYIIQNASRIVGLHSMQDDQGKAGQTYVCQRLLKTGAKASHAGRSEEHTSE